MELGAPTADGLRQPPHTLQHLVDYTQTAPLGVLMLSANDHLVSGAMARRPTAGRHDGTLGGDDACHHGDARGRAARSL
jgi:hypothetical protein